ncbi:MAG TPA: HAD-IC family P-type ATPase, partial [Polyangia bacterium]
MFGEQVGRSRGLSSREAADRLKQHGRNELQRSRQMSRLRVLGRQLRSPLLLLLVFAAAVSAFTGQWTDAVIVFAIVIASAGIGYIREYKAQTEAAALQRRIQTRATALRDGNLQSIPIEEVVPGDVVILSAGALVPADGVLLEATDLFVSETMLNGESFPVEKRPFPISVGHAPGQRQGWVFLGTNVRSGTGRCLVMRTGSATEFGAIARRLLLRAPDTEFDRGIQRFGYLLSSAMLVMVLLVFAAHMLLGRPVVDTLLFAIALAVGLSPELLPAILSVNLARGAAMMAGQGVLVRRLNAIENLGSMNILCTDKTGTLTEGVVEVDGAYDPEGRPASGVLSLAGINAALETGLANPLDEAILRACGPDVSDLRKLGEVPFDFTRKRISVLVDDGGGLR